jgi:hypothetical protein
MSTDVLSDDQSGLRADTRRHRDRVLQTASHGIGASLGKNCRDRGGRSWHALSARCLPLDRRDLIWINVTANPTAEWVARQITEAFPWDEAPRYMIRDRDRIYGALVTRPVQRTGVIRSSAILGGLHHHYGRV